MTRPDNPLEQRWARIDAHFDAALELPPEDWPAFLDRVCGDDPAVRGRVAKLLQRSRETDRFLTRSLVELYPAIAHRITEVLEGPEPDLPPGHRIDRYVVLEFIGRGGSGNVYLAEPHQGRPLRRVALKVLRRGLDTDDVLERFKVEQHVLAAFDHPSIVPLLDAGATEDGRPYLVMPYVPGSPITEYCEAQRLSIPERLTLFLEVARAVRHAHRNLVVHRDLKPSNILVAPDGTPKLLDFGIAKLLDKAALGGEMPRTRPELRLLTPEYASPEQRRGGPVTPASDVYQLGLLLYELVSGVSPLGQRDRCSDPRGVERRLCRPSRALAEAGEDLADIAARRGTDPGTLRRWLQRGLDQVVATALEPDQDDRYPTVDVLIRDVKDLLAGRRPRGARRPRRSLRLSFRLASAPAWIAFLTALTIGATWAIWQPEDSGADHPAPRLAVLPFTVHGMGDHAYLGEGLVDLLSTALDDVGGIRTVSPHALLGFTRAQGIALPDTRHAAELADHFNAGFFVVGDVMESDDGLRISATLHARNATESVARVSAEGSSGELLHIIDDLTARLIGAPEGPWGREARMAARTTASLPALRAYLQGENWFRAGRYEDAVDAFQRATEADTTFALAYYRLSHASEWANRFKLGLAAAELAVQHADRLPPRHRLLLEALLTERRGDGRDAERRYRALLGAYPDDPHAWWGLAEVLFHYGPAHGKSITEARAPFERVLDIEPEHVEALWHLARIAALEGRHTELDSIVGRIERLHPESDLLLEMKALRAFAMGNAAEREEILDELAAATDYLIKTAAWSAAVFVGDVSTAKRVARLFTDPARSADMRAIGHVWTAHLQLARGSMEAALEGMGAVAPLRASTTGIEYEALLLLAPFLSPSTEELAALRERLQAWDADAVPASAVPDDVFAVHDGLHPMLRLYLLGLVEARLEHHDEALDRARALETGAPWPDPALAARLANSVQAEVEWLRGDLLAALGLLEQPELHASYARQMHSPYFAQTRERFIRGKVLASLERYDEALTLFGSFGERSLLDLIYLAPSHLQRAEIHRVRDELRDAEHHQRRFEELWREPEEWEIDLGLRADLLWRPCRLLMPDQEPRPWGSR